MKKGIAACEGIGIGKALVLKIQNTGYVKQTGCDSKEESERLNKAFNEFFLQNSKTAEEIRKSAGDSEALIIEGHSLMLKDPYMTSEINKLIDEGNSAEYAFGTVCDTFITMFSSVDDDFTKQRAADVKDVKNDVLGILLGVEKQDLSNLPENTIIVAEELTPSVTAGFNPKRISGIVTATGSKTSHAAILARTLGIPAILSLEDGITGINDGDSVIVDGINGLVYVNSDENILNDYIAKSKEYEVQSELLKKYLNVPTVTADGVIKRLACNIGSPEDLKAVKDSSGEEIGLFRTEFLFMDRNSAPTEQEQFEAYKKAASEMNGKPVIIRTLDIGGDKDIPYLGLKKEENPFLGFRAIRYCLKNESVFRTQLKALLKAAVYGDIRIMIPLVVNLAELRSANSLLKEVEKELENEGAEFRRDVKLGVMIETPAAVMMAEELANEADFFSIGTNDLTQYILAVDRGNPDTEYLYSALNPAVLRAIKHIIACAKNASIPVGMCGEAASDELMIPLLVAFGLDEFSVNPASVLKTRSIISKWSEEEAQELAERVLSATTSEETLDILKKAAK